MKKILFAIQQWWHKVGAEYHRKKVLRIEHDIWEEAMHRLQVREFNGTIYLCLDNVPIADSDSLVEDMAEAVQEARTNFFDYTYYKRRGMLPEAHR